MPERGGQAVAVLGEDEERMLADGLDVAGVGRRLVRAVARALGAVDIHDQPPRERAGRRMLHQCRVEVSATLVSLRSREISIRKVGSAAGRSASWVSSSSARRL